MQTPSVTSILHSRTATFPIPPHDHQAFTFVGDGAADDDNVETISFYQGGADGRLVAMLTFSYVGSTNNVATITLSVP